MRNCLLLCLAGIISLPVSAQKKDSISQLNKLQHLDEVVINSRSVKQRVDNVQIGQEKIKISELMNVPSLMGEHDIFKSLQLLPGIKSESEASSGFEVRGGTSSQNLVLLDNTPIYQAGHLMGMFSSFNDNALTNATLYKGMIPAQYGDATSSILDVMTKSGDMNTYHYGGTLGLLSAKAYAEGPLITDKLSFLVTARRSYADIFLKASEDYKNTRLYFYDMNGRLDWKVSDNNRLSLSAFHGKDLMEAKELSSINWINTSLNLKWIHYFGEKLITNTTVYFTHYKNYMDMDGFGLSAAERGYINHYGLNHNYQWMPSQDLKFNFGLQSVLIDLCSAEWRIGNLTQKETRKAWENAAWVNGTWTPVKPLTLSAGIRVNSFSALGGSPYYQLNEDGNITDTLHYSNGDFVKTHLTIEPRFSANLKLSETQSLKLGYTLSSQNIRAVRTSSWSMPFDRYTMSSNLIKPEIASQVSLGYAQMLDQGAWDFSMEGYYKDIDNVYDYRDGKSFTSEIEIERLLLGGKSRAYGAEVGIHKNHGKLTGWLSYTLSWVENKIEGINNGDWYTANNDRRHDLSLVLMYKLNDKWDFSASWKYNTGQALTAPSGKYKVNGQYVYYYKERNGYRAPSYHRLDVGANYTVKKPTYTGIWSFGIYNLYNRMNPFMVGFNNDSKTPSGVQAYRVALFGIIPSVAYTINF